MSWRGEREREGESIRVSHGVLEKARVRNPLLWEEVLLLSEEGTMAETKQNKTKKKLPFASQY